MDQIGVDAIPGIALPGKGKGISFGQGLGIAGVGTAGFFGAKDGFSRGGASGNAQGVASILGAISAIPGPQQPFVAAGAIVSGVVAQLFGGDSKEKRDREIRERLERNVFREPEALSRTLDTRGNEIELNSRFGRQQIINISPRVEMTINAMDAKSIIDRKSEIGEAVRLDLSTGSDLGRDLRERFIAQ